ncbi:NKG2-A/NKG2-B type II integral membrane protein-like [Ochotona curzoniae]|uniref:NKG2-A/NKG2-B type II integral membrane protein-like n=1 Tax=Ochotona curzoniae TaxID=130825 RepID=UPI001B34D1F6|nr:NKG2-A/NKG2-B type II integral membrane protein-like [Ochotona curzoniae]
MRKERVVYAELNVSKGSKQQQKRPQASESSTSATEEGIIYLDLNLSGASRENPGNGKGRHCKDSASSPEKLISKILGIICFVLSIMIALTATGAIPSTETQEQNHSSHIRRTQKANHCHLCPKEWFSYSNHCYYLSTEKKTWSESVAACASKNSSLLYIDSEEEMKFLNLHSVWSWIGVSRKSSRDSWMTTNGSTFKLQISESSYSAHNCVMFYQNGLASSKCGSLAPYSCKHKLWD